ncbi:MAG TPA: bifunctional DNA-formamidopyrimidine glycosylase/DNA-(apurinic or apyrimidinic site) lyase [Myxococcota bacterium]|nr:bifunctional DNA-formamidopyrimidine glycosylase/DNA-(apurinic or apyrimidinic site) lyase [Myxococcota bacterium]
MPELPEVEVTRRRIEPALVGRTVRGLRTTAPSYFFLTPPGVLRRRIAGRTVERLDRHGKYLIAGLDDGARLMLHLGMTGQLFPAGTSSVRLLSATARASLPPEAQPGFRPDAHTHLVFRFKDEGPEVFFRDVRKFGKVLWIAPGADSERLSRLGCDALELTGEHLFAATRRRTVALKNLLMAQAVVAGVGNIYADEALFGARVRPTRRAGKVTRAECERIAREVRRVMLRAIETGGSSISDYVAPDGSDGAYQDERRVYARAGEPCPACGAPVKKIVLGARGTHYCPRCQR